MVLSRSPGGSLVPREGAACYWFYLYKRTRYGISELRAAGFFFFFCPRLVTTIERYGASLGFHREVKDTAVSKSHPHPALPLCCVWLLLGFSTSPEDWLRRRPKERFTVFLFFYFICRNDVICISSGTATFVSARVCVFYMHLCTWVRVCLCARRLLTVCVCSVWAQECLRVHVFHVGWGRLRDITAIYWATRDWAHRHAHTASRHKWADRMLMQY